MAVKDYIIAALLARGEEVAPYSHHEQRVRITRKYLLRTMPNGEKVLHPSSGVDTGLIVPKSYYWIGRNGSVKVGAQLQRAMPLSPHWIIILTNEGKALADAKVS